MVLAEVMSKGAPIPGRTNEDAWFLQEFSHRFESIVLAGVVDGAGTPYSLAPLAIYLEQQKGMTSASFAAKVVQSSFSRQLLECPTKDLKEVLLEANRDLGNQLEVILGEFSEEYIVSLHPEVVRDDPRRIRLLLPACVATIIRIDTLEQKLEFAHAGDTSLFEVQRNGTANNYTVDQMGEFDKEMLKFADRIGREEGIPHFKDVVGLPKVALKDGENRIHHNFVDIEGNVNRNLGCGVLNGLSELNDYVETGVKRYDLQNTTGFCLITDGLQLLEPLNETDVEKERRFNRMGQILIEGGLHALFEEVSVMVKRDPYYDKYPRVKEQDDATGIWLRVDTE